MPIAGEALQLVYTAITNKLLPFSDKNLSLNRSQNCLDIRKKEYHVIFGAGLRDMDSHYRLIIGQQWTLDICGVKKAPKIRTNEYLYDGCRQIRDLMTSIRLEPKNRATPDIP